MKCVKKIALGAGVMAWLGIAAIACGENLSRVTRFPLGLQSGSCAARTLSDEDYVLRVDSQVKGPGGVDCLYLDSKGSGQPLIVFLPPVEIGDRKAKHAVSLSIRGKGIVDLNVLADGAQIAGKRANATENWARAEVTYQPKEQGKIDQVMVAVWGTVWIDWFQVEKGETAGAFKPAMDCEVALAMPEGEASAARIQFENEEPLVQWAVMGTGAALKAKVVDIHGNQRPIAYVQLKAGGFERGTFRFDVLGEERLGTFRIEAWVEDRQGRRISPFNELLVTRVQRPRHWGEDAPDSPFGIHAGSVHRQLLLAKAVGINWARLHDPGSQYIAWSYVEPEKGKWQWYDRDIQRYRDHRIKVMGALQQSPGWASGYGGGTPVDYWARYLEPLDLTEYATYVRTITARYRGVIDTWDVWNEPWGKFWDKWDAEKKKMFHSPKAAEEFVALQKMAYETAKSVDDHLRILGVNTTGRKVGEKWTGGVVAAGGLGPCDVYCYHDYSGEKSGFPGDKAETIFHEAWGPAMAALPGGKLDKPVWMSEGCGTDKLIGRGMYHYSVPGAADEDVLETCDRAIRWEVAILGQGAQKVFLYSTNEGGEFHPDKRRFQALVTDDDYPHPCAAAHAAMAWELEDTHFVKRAQVARGVYAYLFAGNGRSVAVIMSANDFAPYRAPRIANASVRDLFGNILTDGEFAGQVMYIEAPLSADALEQAITR